MSAPDPVTDAARLAAVHATGLIGETSEALDRLSTLARTLLRVPATFLSIVDEERDYYLSQVGFGEPLATSRELEGRTFCHLAIESESPLVIGDTSLDPVHAAIPTVRSLGVGAYLGIPVRLPGGELLGSFCAIDNVPRVWSDLEQEVMVELARSAEREIALGEGVREASLRAEVAERQAAEIRDVLEELRQSHWHITRFQDLLPLCMACQNVHLPDAGWKPLVDYLARDGLLVSHGYCPTCAEGLTGALSPAG